MFAIYWIGSVKYKPLVECIEPNLFKREKGFETPTIMFLATKEQSQVVKLKPPLGASPT